MNCIIYESRVYILDFKWDEEFIGFTKFLFAKHWVGSKNVLKITFRVSFPKEFLHRLFYGNEN